VVIAGVDSRTCREGNIYKDGHRRYQSSLKSIITMTVDTSQNQFSLQLFSFTTNDTAVYFCE
jgi:hypothetical protein